MDYNQLKDIITAPIFILLITLFLNSIIRKNLINRYYAKSVPEKTPDEEIYKSFIFSRPHDRYLFDKTNKSKVQRIFLILNFITVAIIIAMVIVATVVTIRN